MQRSTRPEDDLAAPAELDATVLASKVSTAAVSFNSGPASRIQTQLSHPEDLVASARHVFSFLAQVHCQDVLRCLSLVFSPDEPNALKVLACILRDVSAEKVLNPLTGRTSPLRRRTPHE
ncbi:hypothetical protein B7463_g12195, partial [Scytalidium lignicola]